MCQLFGVSRTASWDVLNLWPERSLYALPISFQWIFFEFEVAQSPHAKKRLPLDSNSCWVAVKLHNGPTLRRAMDKTPYQG